MKKNLILLSGWAQPPKTLKTLCRLLSDIFNLKRVTSTDFFSAKGMEPIFSEYKDGCFVLGWSMGGMIAMESATQWPDTIKGLILINSTARFCSDKGYSFGLPGSHVRALRRSIKKDPEDTLIDHFTSVSSPHPVHVNILKDKAKQTLETGVDTLCSGLAYLLKTDLRRTVKSIQQRTLILHGLKDVIVPSEAGTFLSKTIPISTIEYCENIGHDLPMRRPRWIFEKVETWL
ncbi:MAG: hypothetical protein GKR87_05050 [Kiritimatiellae bacterium]|nr:hypothetical protein [Kiritimatiellia bacterium]